MDQLIRSGIIPLASVQGKDIAFVPDETTVTGVSLAYQLFVSQITQLILWCRDHFEKALRGRALEAELRQAFFSFWESRGHSGPDHLDISVGDIEKDDQVSLKIELGVSRQILPSGGKVALDLFW